MGQYPSNLRLELRLGKLELSDLRKNTYFDKCELQQWSISFGLLPDSPSLTAWPRYQGFIIDCPEGRLDKKDFGKIYTEFFPFDDPTEFPNDVFDVFDENKNGYIDFKEFICSLVVTNQGSLEEKLRWAFQLYDINKDGTITYQEILQIVQAIDKMADQMLRLPEYKETPEKRVEEMIRSTNKDKDAKFTYNEFVGCSKQDSIVLSSLSFYNRDGLASDLGGNSPAPLHPPFPMLRVKDTKYVRFQ
ncbi:EF-hand [Lactarius psammicola]|nr:EF-hand [Lactarius psammicola]